MSPGQEFTHLRSCLIAQVIVSVQGGCFGQTIIVGFQVKLIFSQLNPATWPRVPKDNFYQSQVIMKKAKQESHLLVSLLDETWPIFNRAIQMTNMDKIERIHRECPLILSIINLKCDIWRDPNGMSERFLWTRNIGRVGFIPIWLYWAKVGSDHLGGWIAPTYELTTEFSLGCGFTHSAISIAQIPVPVPTSRILWG